MKVFPKRKSKQITFDDSKTSCAPLSKTTQLAGDNNATSYKLNRHAKRFLYRSAPINRYGFALCWVNCRTGYNGGESQAGSRLALGLLRPRTNRDSSLLSERIAQRFDITRLFGDRANTGRICEGEVPREWRIIRAS